MREAVKLLLKYQGGQTQTELARKFRCSQPTIWRLLSGVHRPGLRLALRIKDVAGIDPNLWSKP